MEYTYISNSAGKYFPIYRPTFSKKAVYKTKPPKNRRFCFWGNQILNPVFT